MVQTIKIPKYNQAASINQKSKMSKAANHEKNNSAKQRAAEWLKDKYGVEFNSKTLPFARRIDGTIAFHQFDLVSPDKQIVAEVRTHKIIANGNLPSAKILDTYMAIGMLERVSAKTKILILSDLCFYKSFRNNSFGKIAREIEVACIADEQQQILTCV